MHYHLEAELTGDATVRMHFTSLTDSFVNYLYVPT